MFETFLMVILLPVSIIFNILLLIRGINLVKQNEKLSDVVNDYDVRQDNTLITLENMLGEMKEIDLKGSFESDDEVGVVFSELKNTIESYKNQIQ
jgi:hypothetical protein